MHMTKGERDAHFAAERRRVDAEFRERTIGRAEGAAVAFGLMGMAEAIRENDNVKGCPWCGIAPAKWAYCEECTMCNPDECLFRICTTCEDQGRGFDVPDADAAERSEGR